MANEKTVLILGASRGLGLALAQEFAARGYHVIATERTPASGLADLAVQYGERLEIATLDITDAEGVRALRRQLDGRRIDILFVNAGIALAITSNSVAVEEQEYLAMMLTNALAPVRALELLRDLVPQDGVLAVMTSELGSITNGTGFWQLYSSSKAALNMLMKGFASHHAQEKRAILLMAPGWVRTEMGGAGAILSIEESIPLVVDVVEANRGVPGLRYLDRFGETLPW